MPDFSNLMNRKAGEAPKPKALPVGTYSGVIKGWEVVEAPAGKDYTAIIRFQLGLTDWPESVSEEDKLQDMGNGQSKPIDLSKKSLRRDFYDNGLFRLDEFIKSCGVEANGRSYAEVLPEMVGSRVNIEVQQYVNQKTSDIGNQVGQLVGQQ